MMRQRQTPVGKVKRHLPLPRKKVKRSRKSPGSNQVTGQPLPASIVIKTEKEPTESESISVETAVSGIGSGSGPSPSSTLHLLRQINCLVCFKSFSNLFYQNMLDTSDCEEYDRMFRTFAKLLDVNVNSNVLNKNTTSHRKMQKQLESDQPEPDPATESEINGQVDNNYNDDDVRFDFDFSIDPFPFCSACQNLVTDLCLLQEDLESIQEQIKIAVDSMTSIILKSYSPLSSLSSPMNIENNSEQKKYPMLSILDRKINRFRDSALEKYRRLDTPPIAEDKKPVSNSTEINTSPIMSPTEANNISQIIMQKENISIEHGADHQQDSLHMNPHGTYGDSLGNSKEIRTEIVVANHQTQSIKSSVSKINSNRNGKVKRVPTNKLKGSTKKIPRKVKETSEGTFLYEGFQFKSVSDGYFECCSCSNNIKLRKRAMQTHIIYYHRDRDKYPFACSICANGFETKELVEVHLKTHENGKIEFRKNVLKIEMESEPQPYCGKRVTLDDPTDLEEENACKCSHIPLIPSTSESKGVERWENDNDSIFLSPHLQKHNLTHEATSVANVSSESRPKPGSGQGQGQGDCTSCNKKFATKLDLERHSVSHNGGVSHDCPYPNCGKSYIRSKFFHSHLKTHKNKEKKNEAKSSRPRQVFWKKCKVCGKKFVFKAAFTIHVQQAHRNFCRQGQEIIDNDLMKDANVILILDSDEETSTADNSVVLHATERNNDDGVDNIILTKTKVVPSAMDSNADGKEKVDADLELDVHSDTDNSIEHPKEYITLTMGEEHTHNQDVGQAQIECHEKHEGGDHRHHKTDLSQIHIQHVVLSPSYSDPVLMHHSSIPETETQLLVSMPTAGNFVEVVRGDPNGEHTTEIVQIVQIL